MEDKVNYGNPIMGITDNSSGSTFITNNDWRDVRLIDTVVYPDRIELIYKEIYTGTYTSYGYNNVWSGPPYEDRVFKKVYSCKDGKWHESDKIYGRIIPPSEETYNFTDE